MDTLLTTNILLLLIVIAIVFLTVLIAILLVHLIGTTRKIKHVATVFDDDVIRARSVVIAIKDLLLEKLFGKDASQNTTKKKKK